MKIVIILDPDLPPGVKANAAAVLAFSASRQVPGGIGPEVADADGGRHPGITSLPIPVLGCPDDRLADLRDRALAQPGGGLRGLLRRGPAGPALRGLFGRAGGDPRRPACATWACACSGSRSGCGG